MLALIGAAEEPHAVREKHRARRRCAARQRMPVEHAFDLGLAADAAPIFRLFAEADQIGRAVFPTLAGIAAAHRAVRLHRRIDVVGRVRVDIEPHDPAGKRHMHAVRQSRIGCLLPVLAAIIAAVDRDRACPSVNPARIFRMYQHRPDVGLGIGQRQPFELVAAIGAAIKPLCAADKDRVGVLGMHGDRMHLSAVRQPAL